MKEESSRKKEKILQGKILKIDKTLSFKTKYKVGLKKHEVRIGDISNARLKKLQEQEVKNKKKITKQKTTRNN